MSTAAAKARTAAMFERMAPRRPSYLAALLALAGVSATAQPEERLTVPLTDPARAATLEVSVHAGSITVGAYDGAEVLILVRYVDGNDGDDEQPRRSDGLRRITNTSLGLTAEERDNTVSVRTDLTQRNIALEISVPRRTSVRARTVHGGEVRITGVAGEHELTNVNGSVIATDIAGAAVAGTTNGDVRVSFMEVDAGKAMSFSTFNGDVDVTFPASLAADLRVNSGRGDLLTDFDVEVRQEPALIEQSGDAAGRYRVRIERALTAVVGGGGPDMQFRTFNGDVTIRRR